VLVTDPLSEHQVHLADPSKQIWLNIATVRYLDKLSLANVLIAVAKVPSLYQRSSNNVDKTSQGSKEVINKPATTNRLEEAVQSLQAFKTLLDRLGSAGDSLDKAFQIAGAVSQVIQYFPS
jgi:hypothetical protein